MLRSTERILTTHCGSLPRQDDLVAVLDARDLGQPADRAVIDSTITDAVARTVDQQLATGLDIVNDGEQSKTSFSSYVAARLGGLTPLSEPFGYQGPTRDRTAF